MSFPNTTHHHHHHTPDFKVRWADGAVLRYSLRTGQLTLTLGEAPALPLVRAPPSRSPESTRRRRHAWVIGGAGMECAATGEAGKYLGQAQWAMRRCLEAEAAAGGWQRQGAGFPVVVYEKLRPAAKEAAEAATATGKDDGDGDYRHWPLVAALSCVGRAHRSARGDLAVALGEVVLVLNPDATELHVLPEGQRFALPGLREVGSGARMPKPLRARMRALQRVLRAVEDGGSCGGVVDV